MNAHYLIESPRHSCEVSLIINPTLQMRKLTPGGIYPRPPTWDMEGLNANQSSLSFDAGRLRPTTQLRLTPKSLHTLAMSSASCLTACPSSKNKPPLQSGCPSPSKSLVQLSHAAQQAVPTYISTSSCLLLYPHPQNTLLQGPTQGPTHQPQTLCHTIHSKPVHVRSNP